MVNSRTKGAAFERLMVKKINSYLNTGCYRNAWWKQVTESASITINC